MSRLVAIAASAAQLAADCLTFVADALKPDRCG